MKTFVLMTKLAPEVTYKMKDRAKIGAAWMEHVKRKCPDVKFLAHYGLLGGYDFMDIYEASSQEEAAKVSMITMTKGAVEAESWAAIPYKRFLEIANTI